MIGNEIITLILNKILDYLAEHVDEIIAAIKEQFGLAETDPEVKIAVQELAYSPCQENLEKLSQMLKDKGENPDKLAALLVTKTHVI